LVNCPRPVPQFSSGLAQALPGQPAEAPEPVEAPEQAAPPPAAAVVAAA